MENYNEHMDKTELMSASKNILKRVDPVNNFGTPS